MKFNSLRFVATRSYLIRTLQQIKSSHCLSHFLKFRRYIRFKGCGTRSLSFKEFVRGELLHVSKWRLLLYWGGSYSWDRQVFEGWLWVWILFVWCLSSWTILAEATIAIRSWHALLSHNTATLSLYGRHGRLHELFKHIKLWTVLQTVFDNILYSCCHIIFLTILTI